MLVTSFYLYRGLSPLTPILAQGAELPGYSGLTAWVQLLRSWVIKGHKAEPNIISIALHPPREAGRRVARMLWVTCSASLARER